MRLTDIQTSLIRQKMQQFFGLDAQVWLFGSRVDDDKKGGDIDLYTEPEIQNPEVLVDAKLNFLVEMHRVFGQQKNDLVLHRADAKKSIAYLSLQSFANV